MPEKARHYGIATGLPETVDPAEGIVLQYDLKIAEGVTCGGAYLKFLTADADIKFEELKDDSPYTVMFGPDKCGATNKVCALPIWCTSCAYGSQTSAEGLLRPGF